MSLQARQRLQHLFLAAPPDVDEDDGVQSAAAEASADISSDPFFAAMSASSGLVFREEVGEGGDDEEYAGDGPSSVFYEASGPDYRGYGEAAPPGRAQR